MRIAIVIALAFGLAGCSAAAGQGGGAAAEGHSAGAAAEGHSAGAAAASAFCHVRGAAPFILPDPRCTPGALDRRVTQADIATTICRAGYTRTVRPPESVTAREKRASMRAYGDDGSAHRYEYDHLVPLELGGAPNDARNLWPEPGGAPNPKDRLENRLREEVCDGTLTLAAARREIARNWVAAYRRVLG